MTIEMVAWITKRNRAYMIVVTGERTDDSTPDETHEVASAIRDAKRIARRNALSFGYLPPFEWIKHVYGWELLGQDPGND